MLFFKSIKTPNYKIISVLGITITLRRRNQDKTAQKFKTLTPHTVLDPKGVSLIGSFKDNSGEAKIYKEVSAALKNSNIPHECIDLKEKKLPRYKNLITFTTKDFYKPQEYNNIPVLWWEFESGLTGARPYAFKNIKAVVTFSKFCAAYFQKIAPKNLPVLNLSCPLNILKQKLEPAHIIRRRYKLSKEDFICFFNFSYFSSYDRKNPEAVLKVFADTLKEKQDAKLVIKTVGSKKRPKLAQRLKNEIKNLQMEKKVIIIDKELEDKEMYSLLNCIDVYISLHRGEGLGLGMLEAMLLKKPVIATDYGGNTDYMDKESACLISYKKAPVINPDLNAYNGVKEWAEPNLPSACRYLKKLYEDKSYRASIGQKAEEHAKRYVSREKFIKSFQTIVNNNFNIKEAS